MMQERKKLAISVIFVAADMVRLFGDEMLETDMPDKNVDKPPTVSWPRITVF